MEAVVLAEFTVTPDVAAQLPVGWPVGFPVLPSPAVKKTIVSVYPRTGISLLTLYNPPAVNPLTSK